MKMNPPISAQEVLIGWEHLINQRFNCQALVPIRVIIVRINPPI